MGEEFLQEVREAGRRRILFLPHAIRQMSRFERMISPEVVEAVIFEGQLVEDYPEDARGHSCLLLGNDEQGAPIHVVCSPKGEYLAIITAYRPDLKQWSENFSRRL